MQIGYSRWPPEAVTKNNKNSKMTMSQDFLFVNEVKLTLCQNDPCMRLFRVFGNTTCQDAKNSTKHKK